MVYASSPFRTLIYSISDYGLPQSVVNEVTDHMPHCVSSFHHKLELRLLQCPAEKDGHRTKRQWHKLRSQGDLSLANRVFSLSTSPEVKKKEWFFGLNDLMEHLAKQRYNMSFWVVFCETSNATIGDREMCFHIPACEAVTRLIEELNLDPETTYPEDLDRLDRRFSCAECAADTRLMQQHIYHRFKTLEHKRPSDLAYTWRDIVSRAVIVHTRHSSTCNSARPYLVALAQAHRGSSLFRVFRAECSVGLRGLRYTPWGRRSFKTITVSS